MGVVRGANAQLKPAVSGKVFGARWYKNQSPTQLERLYDSVGKTFAPSVGASAGHSGFDEEPIYRDVRLCNVVDGVVTAYLGEPGFTRNPASGDVMVEIPRYYYRIDETTEYRDYIISDQQLEGFLISPRHAPHSGKIDGYEKIYISAYELNSTYRSVSGNMPRGNITRAAARNGCRTKGMNYSQYDFSAHWTIGLLYLVEVADWDSQKAVGNGFTGSNGMINTGGADLVSDHSGRADGNATLSLNAAKYRHMENLWGNTYTLCDGINVNGAIPHLCTNPSQYADNTSNNYTALSYSQATADGYIKSLGFDSNVPWAQIPTDSTGASNTYLSDMYDQTAGSGWWVVALGGAWGKNTGAGFWYYSSDGNSSGTHDSYGCRLIMLPDPNNN